MKANSSSTLRVLVFGATGTIGRATVSELVSRGYKVTCFVRQSFDNNNQRETCVSLKEVVHCVGDVTDLSLLINRYNSEETFDAVVSCLASRTGEPQDAWAIDYQAHMNILSLAKSLNIKHMVLLSAICVQKPRLAFQKAKLKFENSLITSGLTYSIVRPTAYFKSLSGQLGRLKKGKPFLVFGNGTSTACKPLSDADLAKYIANCLIDHSLKNKILPIGGPGPAITPRQQGEYIFKLLGQKPRFKQVPTFTLSAVAKLLDGMSIIMPRFAVKAELARIGHYYATESMLLLDKNTNCYDADATPETGQDLLFDYYQRVIEDHETIERGDHAMF